MKGDRILALGAGVLLSLAWLTPLSAQSKDDVKRLVDGSVPAGRTIAFEYQLSTNLASKRSLNFHATGRFEGGARSEYAVGANTWSPNQRTKFVVGPSGTAFLEDPPTKDGPRGWRAFNPLTEMDREPAYGQFVLPQIFLASLHSYPEAFEKSGTQGHGGVQTEGYQGAIAPERVKQLLAQYGLALQSGQSFETVSGTVVLWIGKDDGLLRAVEFELRAEIKEEKKPEQAAGGTAPPKTDWEFGDELDPNQGMMTARMKDPKGADATDTSIGGAQAEAEELKKRLTIGMSLQHPGEGEKPPEKIEPDPDAARLVSW